MQKKFIILLFFPVIIYSQQQVDISWPTLAKSDWPMIKHDPQFTGRSPYKGPQTPNIIWTADLEYGILSGPVIGTDDNLYFGTNYADPNRLGVSDYFYCYTHKGEFVWEYKTGTKYPPKAGILIDSSNTIYFGGATDRYLYALNPDGTLKWKYETSAIMGVPLLNIDLEGNIYVTNDDSLYSITNNGTLNWSRKYESGFFTMSPVFSPDGQTIYIAGKDSNLFALNLNGDIKWKFRCGKVEIAPIIDSDGNIYFGPKEKPQYLYCLYPNSDIKWKYLIQSKWTTGIRSIPAIDYNGNIYFITTDTTYISYYPKSLVSINNGGVFRWKYLFIDLGPDSSEDFLQPLICDSEGTIYVGSTYGWYYYSISADGALKWKLPLEFGKKQVDYTGAIYRDGTLFIGVHGNSLFAGSIQTLIAIKDTGVISVDENKPSLTGNILFQNYPNPFNAQSTFKYELNESGFVDLRIYNILGKEVALLVQEEKFPGLYSIEYDARDLPSGVYFYELKIRGQIQTKKMLLLK